MWSGFVKNYKEERPWGSFENLLDTDYCKVKRLIVKPGQRLSSQYHHKRSEAWIVVQGEAVATLDDVETSFENTEEDLYRMIQLEPSNMTYLNTDDLSNIIKLLDA